MNKKILPPEKGCYTGAFASEWIPHSHFKENLVMEFEEMAKRKLAIVEGYVHWVEPFPTQICNRIVKIGSIPLITWEPWAWGLTKDVTGISLQQIIDGKHDKFVKKWAREARAWSHPFFLRWAHEFNGYWYPWGGYNNGDGALKGYGSHSKPDGPERYVDAYRRIYDILSKEGATNITWVWCPSIDSVPDEPWNQPEHYYPGNDYVDWIGVVVSNWGLNEWFDFKPKFSPFYKKFASRRKPIFLCVGSAEVGGNKRKWISETFYHLKKDFPRVKAFSWFNIKKERDWIIWSDTGKPETSWNAATFRDLVSDPYFIEEIKWQR